MEKEFGKLSREQFKRFLALYHQALLEKGDVERLRKEQPELVESLIKNIPWAVFYELPYMHFLALFFHLSGLPDILNEFAKREDPNEAAISFTESGPELPPELDNLTEEDKGVICSMVMAIIKNLEAIQQFHMSMNDLIKRAKDDDEALFDAVLVDRMAVCCPTVASRIAKAHATNDENFFDLLSKAIKKTRPRRPKEELDDLRFMATALDQAVGLSNLPYEKIHDVLIDDFQLYPDDIADSFGSLKKFLQRRKKDLGDMKT